ncbi:unnamed protein product [Acanthoscelides obtectus]|uniref:Uncharacterized protein n=1 Tax=Acanthoscelides obtectus TaxID=200917 RepID=A0A9P0K154_ACAOB|nr:unnamed protein product [Acanthoscelides obtectus]CAK1623826.1 Odorant receptor 94b [Acanthoscelides obtectus]
MVKLLKKDKEPFFASYIPPVMGQMGVLVFQEIMIMILGHAGCVYIILDINLMIAISIQVEILKDILTEVADIDGIIQCIKRYEQIIRLVENVQHIFRVGMSIHFLTGILIFCTTLFKLMEVEVDYSQCTFLIPYSFAIISILFNHCWFGNDIIYRSSDLTHAIFRSRWVGSKLSTQKTLILFMAFTKKPLSINLASGLFTMAIPVFVSVCRTAYSFFTILQKFK